MSTIHNEIESWLVADVHEQLSREERASLQQHLAECADCRATQAEEKTMDRVLKQTLGAEAADPAFEQRMVSRFRDRIPERRGVFDFVSTLMRTRPAQIAGVAALLLTLVQVGRMVTGEAADGSPIGRVAAVFNQEDESDSFAMSSAPTDQPRRQRSLPASAKQRPAAAPSLSANQQLMARSGVAEPPAPPPAPPQAMADAAAEGRAAPEEAMSADMVESVAAGASGEARPGGSPSAATPDQQRKLIRTAQVYLEVVKFEDAVARIAAFAQEDRGLIATSSSEKLANGKLQGTVVAKVIPENLDRFLQKLRTLGELKNQTLGSDDVTKNYFDTDSRLRNSKRMEERLLDMLGKTAGKVGDLLQVEKELGRVRQEIEQMQGELKYWDALVSYATVTISLAEKDLDEAAAFLLKRTANLALFSTDVEKTFADLKGVAGDQVQIVNSNLERDYSGQVTARLALLIVPEKADEVIGRIKGMGRVQSFNESTQRIAQDGSAESGAQKAKVKHDKVALNITVTRDEQEPSVQQTSLRLLTGEVTEKVTLLKKNAAQYNAEIRDSTFSRGANGEEFANVTLRVPMKDYAALVRSFDQLGKVKDLTVQRQDRPGVQNEETAPADITVQIYSQGNIVSDETGLFATIRRTLAQGAAALMWSLRLIGVALAFFAPWVAALAGTIWLVRFIRRKRAEKNEKV